LEKLFSTTNHQRNTKEEPLQDQQLKWGPV